MHRRFSSLVKPPKASGSTIDYDDDTESKVETIVRDEPLPPASLKMKRVDYYYSRWGKQWKYRVLFQSFGLGATFDAFPEYEFQSHCRDTAHYRRREQ